MTSTRKSALLAALALVVSLLPGAVAHAAARGGQLTLHPIAASFRVRTAIVLTGTATPASGGSVALERLVAKKWQGLAHAKPTSAGLLRFSIAGPKKQATWTVRAVRAKSRSSKALASSSVRLHIVANSFAVTASVAPIVTAGSPIVVTGTVVPSARGSVALQLLSGTTWSNVGSARLTKGSTFSLALQKPLGSYRLRVVRSATTAVAQGISPGVQTTVALPPLAVSTLTLPDATVRLPYAAQVAATGGLAPYTWSATGLPAGLTIAPTGAISGTPTAPMHASVTVTVTDARAVSSSASLSLYALVSPSAANVTRSWGVGSVGELGDGRTTDSPSPVVVATTGFTAVSSLTGTAVALRYDG